MLKRHLFTTFAALVALIGSATTTNIAYADPSAPASQAPETITLANDLPITLLAVPHQGIEGS